MSPHHFTKSTVQAEIYCNACMKMTPWRVADGRRQYSLTCYARKEQERADRPKESKPAEQIGLFK